MRKIFLPLLGIVALLGFADVLFRALYEWQGTFHTDAAIYATVARGMLNGLLPYADLFENKAPGVYLTAALSLRLFDDLRILSWLQGAVLLLLPLLCVLPFRKSLSQALLAWILGCVLSLYTGVMAGQLLPESFGAFFGVGFIAVLASTQSQSKGIVAALGALMLLAAGLKEPFFLSILGGSLLVLPSFQSTRRLAIPIALAVVVGAVALMVLGHFVPYVTIHLAHMFSFHMYNPWGTVGEPLWLRFIDVPRIAANAASFSAFLPWLLLILWAGSLAALLQSKDRTSGAGRWLIASFCVTLTIGFTGDFYSHHFIFPVPVYAAMVIVLLRALPVIPVRPRRVATGLVIILSSLILINAQRKYSGSNTEWHAWADPKIHAAAVLDDVMDRCRVDRYLVFIDRPEGFYGFPHHSPYGPIFTQYSRFFGVSEWYMEGFSYALEHAPLLVTKEGEEQLKVDATIREYLRRSFTEEPWECAKPFEQPVPYHIIFRTGAR